MSEAAEKTAGGATRGLLGSLSFILVMVGVEGMTGDNPLRFGFGIFLALLGVLFAYAAFFWETAKKVLSDDAQTSIAKFAQHRITWTAIFFLVLQSLILSKFIEGRRWPFSYPSDPEIYKENAQLKNEITAANSSAQKVWSDASRWKAAYNLRYGARTSNGGLAPCSFTVVIPNKSKGMQRWAFLQPILDMAHWENIPRNNNIESELNFQEGITIRSSDNDMAAICAKALGRSMSDLFGGNVTVSTNQTNNILEDCKNRCVEIDVME